MTVTAIARRDAAADSAAGTRWQTTPAVFVLLLAVTSRGVIEVVTGKQVAYAVQLICALALVWILHRRGAALPGGAVRWGGYVALYILVIGGVASAIITLNTWHLDSLIAPALYVATFAVLGLMLCWGTHRDRVSDNLRVVTPGASAVVLVQVAVASGQQYLGWTFAAGSDQASVALQVRPAGLTGSYLHYPLVLSVLAILLVGAWMRHRRPVPLVCAGVAVAGVLLSYSRSGMMILALTLVFALLFSRTVSTRLATLLVVGLVVAAVLLFLQGSPVLDRALSALDLESSGNAGRVAQWAAGFETWSRSPLLLGSHTGLVTNITRNFGGVSFGVVESSLLQQLLNLGIVGAVATYWLLLAVVRAVPTADVWVRAGAAACVAQTVIYQFVEVLPFVTLLAILPLTFSARPVVPTHIGQGSG